MRDDYGRLIRAEKGAVGALREGGDSFGGRPLAVVPTKTVALFSGLVKVGAGGMANVTLDVPDFNGELRLMAVALSADKLGHADRPLTVRDPVVADIVLPRFLAPGDHASAALNLNNVEGAPGNLRRDRHGERPGRLAQWRQADCRDAGTARRTARSGAGCSCEGRGLGIATIALNVKGPGGFNVTHSWQIELRAPQLDIAREETLPFAREGDLHANRPARRRSRSRYLDGRPDRRRRRTATTMCRAC